MGYLINIELDLHSEDKGKGYDLIFTFDPNNYFKGTTITKSLFITDSGILDKTTSTPIEWKDNCNPTMTKKKKKKGGKKVNVEVKCDSFFNFFNTIDPALEDDKEKDKKPKEDDDEFDDDGIENRLADDLDQAD